jgi:cytidine deaminase
MSAEKNNENMLALSRNKSNSDSIGQGRPAVLGCRRAAKNKDSSGFVRVYNGLRFRRPVRDLFPFMQQKTLANSLRARLSRSAKKVMKNAHAPYSKFRVGAAILLSNGKVFCGCNVENASYGMTNCAERTAIFSAVAELGPKIEISAVSVVNDQGVPCAPCGACRQVIYEFGPDATVFFQGAGGPRQAHITELLPEGFRLQ